MKLTIVRALRSSPYLPRSRAANLGRACVVEARQSARRHFADSSIGGAHIAIGPVDTAIGSVRRPAAHGAAFVGEPSGCRNAIWHASLNEQLDSCLFVRHDREGAIGNLPGASGPTDDAGSHYHKPIIASLCSIDSAASCLHANIAQRPVRSDRL